MGVPTAVVPQGPWRKVGGRLKAMLFQIPRLRRIAAEFRPDLIHGNEFHIIPQALRAGRGRIPVTGHVRLGILPRQIVNYELGRCSAVITVSDAVRSLFSETGFLNHVEVVYNGVGLDQIRQPGEAHPEVTRWLAGLPRRPMVAGLFGLVGSRKDQLGAVEAVRRAREAGAEVALVLAGDAFRSTETYGQELRQRIEELKSTVPILWLPFQKDIASLYRAVDVNLLISREEGFGRTIVEAGALGIPSVGTRTGGIPELIVEGETGWLVREGDAGELAGVLAEAAANPERRRTMGDMARRRVETQFTIEAHVERMLAIWRRCVEKAAPSLQ